MISFSNVNFRYRLGSRVFDGLSLRFAPGHVYGVLGENGVGKSTLLKLASGVLFPTSGSVTIEDDEASRRHEATMAKILYVPEEFVLPAVTLNQFKSCTSIFYPTFSEERFEECCRELAVLRDVRLDKLSMGQRKRAFLAFAFACCTPWLLLDEPTNGLDVAAKEAFRKLVANYVDDGLTVVISTHSVREVDSLVDHIVILNQRGLVLDTPIAEVAARLSFGRCCEEDKPLWSEKTLAGMSGVTENHSEEESVVDIEMLFMASLSSPERLAALFNTKTNI